MHEPNTVSREVYESALMTQDDMQHIIDELADEVERLQEQNDRLKKILGLVINRTRLGAN